MKHRLSPFRQGVSHGVPSLICFLILPAQEELMAVELTSAHRASQHLSDEDANE